jgi:catechol 2,3-dioxygenase-like lactoylglutathione lyase family enzyme
MATAEHAAHRKLLPRLPQRLHHYAIVIRDQEANRQFFEDILGIPLVATWCERAFNPEMKRDIDYCHTFYGLADGGALAFFQYSEPEVYERLKPTQLETGQHIAFKTDRPTFDEICRRLDSAGLSYRRIDHGYCLSIYVHSPDNLRIEFTVDCDNAEEIAELRRNDAHAELRRWLGGDHRINNNIRYHGK